MDVAPQLFLEPFTALEPAARRPKAIDGSTPPRPVDSGGPEAAA